jgi:hypothetical protein
LALGGSLLDFHDGSWDLNGWARCKIPSIVSIDNSYNWQFAR